MSENIEHVRRGMICKNCGHITGVLRTIKGNDITARRRECERCGWRGTSREKWVNEPTDDRLTLIAAETLDRIAQLLQEAGINADSGL